MTGSAAMGAVPEDAGSTEGDAPAVAVADLVVHYGDQVAVDGVSLAVPSGTTTAIIGPSGSGKSTLLRAIAGLEPPTRGTVSILGVDRTSAPTNRRRLGLMFQDHALFPHLDVAGNVAFGLEMQGLERGAVRRRTDEVLELVGLAGFGARSVEALSGGEAQRVALARSLAPSPKLLMLDEPLGSLDRVLREDLVGELRLLFSQLDLTVVHVTHDQQEAFSLADELVVMKDGRIEQSGAPADVWRRPSTVFVAEFLGHPNIWSNGDGAVLAPMSSLSLVADPAATRAGGAVDDARMIGIEEVVAVPVDVEFREGRFRVTAVEQTDRGVGRRFVVDSDVRPDGSTPLVVAIDTTQLVSLASVGVQ